MSDVKKFKEFLNEDGGVATATAGNVSGMGAVVTATPSSTPGATMGGSSVGDAAGGDGTVGSGDIGMADQGTHFGRNANVHSRDAHLPRSRRKNKAKAAVKNMKKNKASKSKSDDKETKKMKNILTTFTEFSAKNSIKESSSYMTHIVEDKILDSSLWITKPTNWSSIKDCLDIEKELSVLDEDDKQSFIDMYVKNKIYNLEAIGIINTLDYLKMHAGFPQIFFIKRDRKIYMAKREGYDYVREFLCIENLDKLVNIKENLIEGTIDL